MGYYIFSYGINTAEVLKVFGSGDQGLRERIEQNEVFQGYAEDDWDDFDTNLEQALAHIILGNPMHARANHVYGYALIGICAALGKELPHTQEIKLGYETDFINKALAEDFKLDGFKLEETLFAADRNPFPIPPITDWPLIGVLKLEDVIKLREALNTVTITEERIEALTESEDEEEEEKGYAYEHIKGILENIDFCIQHSLDLISFCH